MRLMEGATFCRSAIENKIALCGIESISSSVAPDFECLGLAWMTRVKI